MALADGRNVPSSLSSSTQERRGNEENNISNSPLVGQTGFVGEQMIRNSPSEMTNKDNYISVEYASKLRVDDDDMKLHPVGGGGGGATFIFKVSFSTIIIQVLIYKMTG